VLIELRNYRAFDNRPASWRLRDGFVAFVGVNNAGKSSLLRFLHEARAAFDVLKNRQRVEAHEMLRGQPQHVPFQSVADVQEVFCNRTNQDATATISLESPPPNRSVGMEPSAIRFRWHRPDARVSVEVDWNGVPGKLVAWPSASTLEIEVSNRRGKLDITRYQEALDALRESIYLGPFRNAVNLGGSDSYYDLAIGEKFIETWDQYKTGHNRALNRAAIAVERELQRIFDLRSLEINAAPRNATLQVIADDEPYQLQEHGAGLAQFIVVMALVATRRPTYILIDEPELNLHPSLQLDFLTTLARYCTRGVAFATHSIGLARAVAEDVYSVRRLDDGGREVRPLEATRDFVQFLGELSLSGYAELGFTQVLLVEGTTEVPTLQRWLRLLGIEHEVVLVPLGGSSLINASSGPSLVEMRRITPNVSVLIDSERATEGAPLAPDRQAFADECERIGFHVHVLERRALENYFTDAAVQAVKGPKHRALSPYESLSQTQPGWAKSEHWRIAAEMRSDDLEGTDLWAFLTSLASRVARERVQSSASEGRGT
jgi:hypothetical protein